jgi:hypothetical protein
MPTTAIRQEAAIELTAIYARHEAETRAFLEALGERFRAVGLTEEQIFGEVMEVIRAASSPPGRDTSGLEGEDE